VRTGFERQVVSALRGRPDLVIDTSLLTAADLKCSLIGHVAFDPVVCAILPRPLPIVGASRAQTEPIFDACLLDNRRASPNFVRRPGWQPVP
jgi:hypothetical protein